MPRCGRVFGIKYGLGFVCLFCLFVCLFVCFFGDDVAKIRSIEEQLKGMKTERSKQETVSDFFSPK